MAEKKAKPSAASKPKRARAANASRARTNTSNGQPTHEQVAEHAYLIYEREGGDSVDNWLRAERELLGSATDAR